MSETDVQLALIEEAAPLAVSREVFCCFEVGLEPRGWERQGATIRWPRNGRPFIHWYVTSEERDYREVIAWAAKAAMRGRYPSDEPVALLIHAFIGIPESRTMREKMDARSGATLPAKPDWDNIGKSVSDALTGIVWTDDAQVADGRVIKRFSDRPAVRVEVREFVTPPLRQETRSPREEPCG